ncbi:hypothetical protein B0H17DRAFT_1144882 [Mycena rosella]|uniref:Uncharacterized protein n=1 Tax=Mycena rosella TaxID=1033263 RepID=A0AAD7CSE8_MYCRO|nr:hypothetical protein B0H17DRAFT_1144882 [Mycena rosella]
MALQWPMSTALHDAEPQTAVASPRRASIEATHYGHRASVGGFPRTHGLVPPHRCGAGGLHFEVLQWLLVVASKAWVLAAHREQHIIGVFTLNSMGMGCTSFFRRIDAAWEASILRHFSTLEAVVAEDNVVGMQWAQRWEEQARSSHYHCQPACCKPGLCCGNAVRVIQGNQGGGMSRDLVLQRGELVVVGIKKHIMQHLSHAMSLPTHKKQRGAARYKREMEAGGERQKRVHRNCADAISTCGSLVGENCGVEHAQITASGIEFFYYSKIECFALVPLPKNHPLFCEALTKADDALDESDLGRWKAEPLFFEDDNTSAPHSDWYLHFTQSLVSVLHSVRLHDNNQ